MRASGFNPGEASMIGAGPDDNSPASAAFSSVLRRFRDPDGAMVEVRTDVTIRGCRVL